MTTRLLSTLAALCLLCATASAQDSSGKKPMKIEAEKHFNEALEHYEKEDYRKAADAFARAHGVEARVEVLFAWAQSERLAGDCDKARELYHRLRKETLPDQDRLAVLEGLERCGAFDKAEEATELADQIVREGSPWYSDWIGDAMLVTGVVALGVGTSYWLISSSERDDAREAFSYENHVVLEDRARRHRFIAIGTYLVGVGLIGGAIARYITRDDGSGGGEAVTAGGWVDGDTAGLAIGGRF